MREPKLRIVGKLARVEVEGKFFFDWSAAGMSGPVVGVVADGEGAVDLSYQLKQLAKDGVLCRVTITPMLETDLPGKEPPR